MTLRRSRWRLVGDTLMGCACRRRMPYVALLTMDSDDPHPLMGAVGGNYDGLSGVDRSMNLSGHLTESVRGQRKLLGRWMINLENRWLLALTITVAVD